MLMIAATYTQGRGFKVADVPVPAIGDGDVLLRVEAAGICGTDLKMLRHGHRKLSDGQTIVLGHEFVGTIEKAGAAVKGLQPGQRVGVAPNIGCGQCEMCVRGLANMCPSYSAFGIDRDGAQAEFVQIPAHCIAQGSVIPITGDVSVEQACLAEPLSCAISGVRAAQVTLGDVVLVYGAGPMGLLNAMVAAASGAARVVVVDRNDDRLEWAKQCGATDVLNSAKQPVVEWVNAETNGRGVDAVIVAVPMAELQTEAIGLLAPYGRLCLFAGLPRGSNAVPLDTNAIHYKQLVVSGMTGGSPADYRDAMKMIEARRIDVGKVVSDTFPMRQMQQAYDRAVSGQGMKVVIVP
jgi:threonine dehydrogenase-like Zn-dependent dehydrogenase